MSDLSLVTDKMLPVSNEVFSNNLSAGISAGAATVPLNSTTGYNEGDSVVLTVDPGVAAQATFVGTIQGNSVINCKWTEGNIAASHALGATVTDYDSATHYNLVTKLLRMTHSQDGKLLTAAVQAALNISSAVPADWTALANTPTVTANNGQKEHVLTYSSVNYTDRLQPGTKLRIPRTGTTPTTSMGFTAASSQYASKSSPTGLAYTTTYSMEALVYVNSFTAVNMGIIGRYDGTNGSTLFIDATGGRLGINCSSTTYATSYQAIPLKKWTHVAGTFSSGTFLLYIDGVSVPLVKTGSGTSVTQAGNLQVGGYNSTAFFDGYIANARIWSTVRTAAEIRDNMNQETPASTTGLVAHFKGNGSWNDSSANLNHLTAAGGAVNNFASHFYSAIEFAKITKVVLSGADTLVTIFSGNGSIPQEVLGATSYSTMASPFGFPTAKGKWRVRSIFRTQQSLGAGTNNVWYTGGGVKLAIPTGDWSASYKAAIQITSGATAFVGAVATLSNANNTQSNPEYTTVGSTIAASNTEVTSSHVLPSSPLSSAALADYFLNTYPNVNGNIVYFNGSNGAIVISAECDY